MIVSPLLVSELEAVLARPKFVTSISTEQASALVAALTEHAVLLDDPPASPERLTGDTGDDYLVALARGARAHAIVSGDAHLTALTELIPPVVTPRAFLEQLGG